MCAADWDPVSWKPRFFTIWSCQAFSLLGSELVQFALVWWLTASTGSGAVLATATIAAVVPGVLLGPFAGAIVDRWNRRHIILVADSLVALCSLVLALLFALGVVRVWHIYLMMAARSVGQRFHWPAMSVATTLMVPEKHYGRVAGLSRSLQGTAGMACPLLGALLVAMVPMGAILAVDVATAALGLLPLFFFRLPQRERPPVEQRRSFGQDLREGVRFVFSWPGLLAILGIAMIINGLGGAAFSLLPLLVTRGFGGQAVHLATLEAANGAAAIAAGLVIAVWGGSRRRMRTAVIGIGLSGLGFLLLSATPASMFPAAVALMACVGITSTVTNASYTAALRTSIPAGLQGRVGTLLNTAEEALKPLFLAAAGLLSDHVGARVWYAIDGCVAIALGFGALLVPAIMHLEERGAKLTRLQEAEITESNRTPPGT